MRNQQSIINPMYRNLAKGKTLEDKLEIMGRNANDIDTLCDLMAGFDTSVTNEPLTHANAIIQRLAREIILNYAGAVDINTLYKASGSLSGD